VTPRVALLWHLHQPDYRDPSSGRPVLPWARLHALRGVRDLLVEAVEHDVAMTINVVPSLLDQLLGYASGVDDRHLELTRAPTEALLADGGAEALALLPAGNVAMTRAWPAYADLRRRLASEDAGVGALRDLQVWATLAWFGATAHRDFEVLGALARKGEGFTEDDKAALLAVHDAVLFDMPARLRAVAEAAGPRLSVSPYFHPILPLLVDVRHARRALPDLPHDVSFAWPEDAAWHLRTARERMAEVAGTAPVGLWPSEGSVSPEVVALAADAGFRWLVSDRGVLERSERTGSGIHGGWDLGHGVRGFFRDTDLSDRIGFRYAQLPAEAAVADFVQAARAQADGRPLTVALDGENPWEAFEDAGGAFRRRLYRAFEEGALQAVTFDALAEEPPVGSVTRLHTGSWIGADFRIWFGHAQDRAAWRALAAVRAAAEEASPEARSAAWPHLMAAEGSDWTWWYGDDFEIEHAPEFDALYRAHLAAAWRALGLPVPDALSRPIPGGPGPAVRPPRRVLALDWAHAATDVGWKGAGRVARRAAAMAVGEGVRALDYGWSANRALWVRVTYRGAEPVLVDPEPGTEVVLLGSRLVVRIPPPGRGALQLQSAGGTPWPEAPLALTPPDEPALHWWEV